MQLADFLKLLVCNPRDFGPRRAFSAIAQTITNGSNVLVGENGPLQVEGRPFRFCNNKPSKFHPQARLHLMSPDIGFKLNDVRDIILMMTSANKGKLKQLF